MSNTIDQIVSDVARGLNLLITGGAGTGKTYIANILRERFGGPEFVFTATTGLAATHIEGAQTIHRLTGIRGKTNIDHLKPIVTSDYWQREHRYNLRSIKTLVIDEISMLRGDTFELLDLMFRHIHEKPMTAFGGTQIILFGDFLQLPPVIKKDEYFANRWVFQTDNFKDCGFKTYNLTKVIRQNDKAFIDALNEIRIGKRTLSCDNLFCKRKAPSSYEGHIELLKLFALNRDVDNWNECKLKDLLSDEFTIGAKIWSKTSDLYHQIKNDVIAPELLTLKAGCQVMILANDKEGEYANGTMGIFVGQRKASCPMNEMQAIYPVLIIRKDNGDEVEVPMKKWTIESAFTVEKEYFDEYGIPVFVEEPEVIASFVQYPVKLAYAMTIHKSQGMTLDNVEIDCGYSHADGQIYVGLSRARTIDGLFINRWNINNAKANRDALAFYETI